MEIPEREENYYWNVAYALGAGITGVLPIADECGPTEFSHNHRCADWRNGSASQRSQITDRAAPHYQNKTERELNSLVKTRFKFNISLNKFFKTLKKIVS
jgi:hypothetical protein